ncbi:hypothetical protein M0R45_008960 [Rubus argutus]|uniref:Uncharacterized protein n=1 Tax=Rubus argutus TaxID=59490 RepID=A0AAW1Y5L4_RUBAR
MSDGKEAVRPGLGSARRRRWQLVATVSGLGVGWFAGGAVEIDGARRCGGVGVGDFPDLVVVRGSKEKEEKDKTWAGKGKGFAGMEMGKKKGEELHGFG